MKIGGDRPLDMTNARETYKPMENTQSMEIEFGDKHIRLKKALTNLDKFVDTFVRVLENEKISYVIVSGYVPILFGRSRHTEDIDLFIEKIDFEQFSNLWGKLLKGFECLNTSDEKEAYDGYLQLGSALRFAERGTFIPNIELKFPKTELDFWTLKSKILVDLNEAKFFIPPLELQIAFKLYLGSDKDLEDARHLWVIFKEYLNKEKLKYFLGLLKIKDVGVLDGL